MKEERGRSPKMSRRTFTKAAGVSAAALAIAGTGGALAWFTGRDEKANRVSVADNLPVEVVEPAWDESSAGNVVPGQHIPKDPRVKNLHEHIEGWLFIEVRVPSAVVSLVDPATGSPAPPVRADLFSFDVPEGWTELESFQDGEESVYRYAWPEPVAPQGETPALFDEVAFANLAEVQGQEGAKRLTVTGYGIQSHGLADCESAWRAYKLQNGITDGTPPAAHAVVAGSTLYLTSERPEVGEEWRGQAVRSVVEHVEAVVAPSASARTPLVATDVDADSIRDVRCETSFAPASTAKYFANMQRVERIDLTGMEVSADNAAPSTFENTPALVYVQYGATADIGSCAPSDLEHFSDRTCYALQCCGAALLDSGDLVFIRDHTYLVPGDQCEGRTVADVWWGQRGGVGPNDLYWGVNGAPWHDAPPVNIRKVRFRDPVSPITMENWFRWLPHLEEIDFAGMDASRCSSMKDMCSASGDAPVSVRRVNLSGLSFDSLETIEGAFMCQGKLEQCDMTGLKAPVLTSAASAFKQTGLAKIDLSSVSAPQLTDMRNMAEGGTWMARKYEDGEMTYDWDFYEAPLSEILIGPEFGSVTQDVNCYQMLMNCKHLSSFDFDSLSHMKKIDNLAQFACASGITSLDLNPLNKISVKRMAKAFSECEQLTVVDASEWTGTPGMDTSELFYNCTSLREILCQVFDVEDNSYIPNNVNWKLMSCPAIEHIHVSRCLGQRQCLHYNGTWTLAGDSTARTADKAQNYMSLNAWTHDSFDWTCQFF